MARAPQSIAPAGSTSWQPSHLQRQRLAYRRGRTIRSGITAALSTVVLLAVLIGGVTSAPGWPRVQETFFSWEKAKESFPAVAAGLWLNIRVMLVCAVVVVILGLALAILRTLRGPVSFPLRVFAAAYTDLFRGLPLILVLLLLGFGVPALSLGGASFQPVVVYGGAALVLTYSAYVAEVFRAGIESVHPSQRAAARSLGLSNSQALRYVVLPQAVRRVLPPLLNDFVSLQKDTALVAAVGLVDALNEARIYASFNFNYTSYFVAAGFFLVLTIPLARLNDVLAARARRRRLGGSG